LLAFLDLNDGAPAGPDSRSSVRLESGNAFLSDGTPIGSEESLVADVRNLTGQYAVAAQSESEGEGIEWTTTVLPIAVALGIVFVIGLFLMRIWHRIDPS
jgi:hypothetical protein